MRDLVDFQEPRQELRGLDGGRADEHGLAALVAILDVLDDRAELVVLREVHEVRRVVSDHRLMGRDHDDLEAVDLLELVRFRVGRSRHAGELAVHAEVVLKRDRRDRLVLLLDLHALLRLDGLVQAVGPTPADHRPAGELVDDDHLAVLDDVVDVALEQPVRAQRRVQVMHQADVRRVVEALALGEDPGAREQLLDFLVPLLGQVRLFLFLVDRVVARHEQLGARGSSGAIDLDHVQAALLRDAKRLARRHRAERFALQPDELDLRRLDLVVGLARRRVVELELRDQMVDPHVELGALLRPARDDQRRARLVDQDRVDLVDDRVDELALGAVLGPEREVVAQIIEAELVVRAVGDVRRVRAALLVLRLVALDDADLEPEEAVDGAHPVRVALREVLVDGHDVDTVAGQRVQIGREGRDERLAFAGPHFGDLALVQRDAADQLHVEMPHLERAHRRLAHERERLGQQRVEVLVGRVALLELERLRAQRLVAQRLESRLERARGGHERAIALQEPLIAAAEDARHEVGNGAEHAAVLKARACDKALYSKDPDAVWGSAPRGARSRLAGNWRPARRAFVNGRYR